VSETTQFSTFKVNDRLYGINVKHVQEITRPMPITKVPLAPGFIHGIINLRGQLATAIGIRELFALESFPADQVVNVVCKMDGVLLSLVVDEIGDVLELKADDFEDVPEVIATGISAFMSGIYKIEGDIISVIDVKKIVEFLNK
jgi:purine-binding chemotaxis protein CheW